jgi:hypothetical protein
MWPRREECPSGAAEISEVVPVSNRDTIRNKLFKWFTFSLFYLYDVKLIFHVSVNDPLTKWFSR